MIDLGGKTALVTGGSRGIGRGIVVRLATQGADVAFSYRGHAEAAAETTASVEALGRRALAVQADVKEPEAAESVVKQTLDGHAAELYQQAKDDPASESSKDKLRRILKMVDPKSVWYGKAQKLLSPG
jgi:NAD(P)-dependent dehydrogenase (short-subunit alcohol dehydrogenase family)